jgi:NAD-dependent deacetylase
LPAAAASGQNDQVAADGDGEATAADQPGWTRGITRLTVLTGAGISTDSGIPDFRGPSGVWTKDPAAEKLSTYQAYLADPALRRRSWQSRLAHPAWSAQPNPAHLAVARLARSTIDTRVITQNIERPAVRRCGSILKSATVMFGENLDPEVFERAAVAATGCDLLLAIGSTLLVEPAASLCAVAAEAGAALVIVNRDPTPYDLAATAVIRDPIGTAVPRIAGQLLAAASA